MMILNKYEDTSHVVEMFIKKVAKRLSIGGLRNTKKGP